MRTDIIGHCGHFILGRVLAASNLNNYPCCPDDQSSQLVVELTRGRSHTLVALFAHGWLGVLNVGSWNPLGEWDSAVLELEVSYLEFIPKPSFQLLIEISPAAWRLACLDIPMQTVGVPRKRGALNGRNYSHLGWNSWLN